jgi:hypothetical protein
MNLVCRLEHESSYLALARASLKYFKNKFQVNLTLQLFNETKFQKTVNIQIVLEPYKIRINLRLVFEWLKKWLTIPNMDKSPMSNGSTSLDCLCIKKVLN